MLKIEFDAKNLALAAAIGSALVDYGTGEAGRSLAGDLLEVEHAPGGFVDEVIDGRAALKLTPGKGQPHHLDTVDDVESINDMLADARQQRDDNDAAFGGLNPDGTARDDNDGAFGGGLIHTGPENAGDFDDLTKAIIDAPPTSPTDDNAVPHNKDLCVGVGGKAPFYATGKMKGQWKRKPGVDDAMYNTWYAAMLAKVPEKLADEPADEPADTSGAFGGGEGVEITPSITEPGELMAWISERQACEALHPATVEKCYCETGVNMQMLFDPKTSAHSVQKVLHWLLAADA